MSIGKADVEFYYGGLVMTVARQLASKPYNSLTHRSRVRVLNRAVDVVQALLNSDDALNTLKIYLKSH